VPHGVMHGIGALLALMFYVYCLHTEWCMVLLQHGGMVPDGCRYFDVVSPMELCPQRCVHGLDYQAYIAKSKSSLSAKPVNH